MITYRAATKMHQDWLGREVWQSGPHMRERYRRWVGAGNCQSVGADLRNILRGLSQPEIMGAACEVSRVKTYQRLENSGRSQLDEKGCAIVHLQGRRKEERSRQGSEARFLASGQQTAPSRMLWPQPQSRAKELRARLGWMIETTMISNWKSLVSMKHTITGFAR